MSYKNILFDLDNTILNFSLSEKQAFTKCFKDYNLELKEGYYELYHEINDSWWKKYELGLYKKEEIVVLRFKELFEKLNLDVSYKDFNNLYVENLSQFHDYMPDAEYLLKILNDKGYNIYIVTNGTYKVQKRRIEESGLNKLIKGVCVSELVGFQKPLKEFFVEAEKLFKIKFDEFCLLVGDSLSSDIQGANNYNIDCCYFNFKNKPLTKNYKITYQINNLLELLEILK